VDGDQKFSSFPGLLTTCQVAAIRGRARRFDLLISTSIEEQAGLSVQINARDEISG